MGGWNAGGGWDDRGFLIGWHLKAGPKRTMRSTGMSWNGVGKSPFVSENENGQPCALVEECECEAGQDAGAAEGSF